MVTHSNIPVGNSHGQSIQADCSPQGHKESDTTERLSIHARKRTDRAGGPGKENWAWLS